MTVFLVVFFMCAVFIEVLVCFLIADKSKTSMQRVRIVMSFTCLIAATFACAIWLIGERNH